MRKIYYRDAVREALDEEMARDPMVMMIGEDVGPNGGTWKANAGLWEKYGDLRMKDSPISESGFVGMCVGMALTGMRPIAEVMFSDFMLVAMDQIVNQMAKITYMSGGQRPVPMVLRTTIGLGRASAAQHSQSLNSIISYFPGLKVVVPSDAYTAKGLLKSAIRDNSPVVVVEHRMQYSQQFDMPDDADENLLIPIGKAAVVREGTDLTIVATSNMVGKSLTVAKHMEKEGVSIEVIDPRTIKPLDKDPADYDRIVLGTPTWWYTMAPAVRTFLTETDLTGKELVLFATHGGWPGHALADMKACAKGAKVIAQTDVQFDSTGGDRQETPMSAVTAWAEKLK